MGRDGRDVCILHSPGMRDFQPMVEIFECIPLPVWFARRGAFSVEENSVSSLKGLFRETESIKGVHRMRAAKEMDSDYLRDGGGASTLSGGLCGRTTRVPWTPAGTMYPFWSWL